MSSVPFDVGDDVEAGIANVAGLDPVDPLYGTEQVIVVADAPAVVGEAARPEIFVIGRKTVLQCEAEPGEVARRRDLTGVREAVRIVEGRVVHAQRARGLVHALCERLHIAADIFGDDPGCVVRGFGDDAEDRILDLDAGTGLQPEL